MYQVVTIYLPQNYDFSSSSFLYSDCREKRSSSRSLDDRACKKLWDMSEKMTGLRSSQSEML